MGHYMPMAEAEAKYVEEYSYEGSDEDEQEEAELRAKMVAVREEEGEGGDDDELASEPVPLDALEHVVEVGEEREQVAQPQPVGDGLRQI